MVEKAGIEPTFTGSGPVSLPLTDFSITGVFNQVPISWWVLFKVIFILKSFLDTIFE